MNSNEAILKQVERLCNGDRNACDLAAAELVKVGQAAVPALVAGLPKCNNGYARWQTVEAINDIGSHDASVLHALGSLLSDADAVVRGAAARTLGNIGPAAAESVAVLLGILQDPDPRVVLWAHYALAKITGDKAHADEVNRIWLAAKSAGDSPLKIDAAYAYLLMNPQ